MEYKVYFRVREDDATGEFGFMLENVDNFNASINSISFFHDVFEHYFENTFPFTGESCENISGEIVAMGHFLYYMDAGLDSDYRLNFRYNRYIYGSPDAASSTIWSLLADPIDCGYCSFGHILTCPVPRVRGQLPYSVAATVDLVMDKLLDLKTELSKREKEERRNALLFRKSVTRNKIESLLFYGYEKARLIAPDYASIEALDKWMRIFSNEFFKINREFFQYADNCASMEVTVRIEGTLSWEAELTYDGETIKVSSDQDEYLIDISDTIYELSRSSEEE